MAADLDLGAVSSAHDEAEGASDDRSRMSFLEHLDELRRRILYSLYALVATCLVTFWYWEPLYRYLVGYLGRHGGQLVFNQPMAGFMFSLKASALVGLLVASPFIFSQLWLFVAPGLYAKEKKVVVPFVVTSTALFLTGAWFAHATAYPVMWKFFASYAIDGALTYLPSLDLAFSLYVKVILSMGLVFQMPVLVFFLARFGVVTAGFMLRKFKYALLIIIVVAAVITPSGDLVTLSVFAVPMLLLYLVSIGVAWAFGRKRRSAED